MQFIAWTNAQHLVTSSIKMYYWKQTHNHIGVDLSDTNRHWRKETVLCQTKLNQFRSYF